MAISKFRTLFLAVAWLFITDSTGQPPAIHSHNDYLQQNPFWEALAAACSSVEADVLLKGDTLYVAHERESIRSGNTFKAMYMEPLRQAKEKGICLPRSFQLLVDCKTEALSTLASVLAACEAYRAYLYRKNTDTGVRIVISGNRPSPQEYTDYPQEYLFFDHQRLDDLSQVPADKVALVSLPYPRLARWNGRGEMPEAEQDKIRSAAQQVHALGLPFRLWAVPDTFEAWRLLPTLGLDFIHTDQPQAVRNFIESHR